MIFLTGDTHGDLNIDRYNPYLQTGITTTKDDYLIIIGDFGMLWKDEKDNVEIHIERDIANQNHKILFIDGNHENFNRLYKLPEVEMFGSKVGKYNDQIYHLKRGNIYTIEDNQIFVMGGANSIDKANRMEHISWWKEEIPSYVEFYDALENLRLNDNKVDYILSHTCPTSIKKRYFLENGYYSFFMDNCQVSKFLEEVINSIEFEKMYFGHMHDMWSTKDRKYNLLYENFMILGE